MQKFTKATMATVALATSVTMLLAGCGGGSSTGNSNGTTGADQPVNGGTVTIGQATKFNPLFIPLMDGGLYTQNITNIAFDSLMQVDKSLKYQPALAKSWTWSADKKTLTMTLQDAKWSDGQPITSDDVLLDMNFLGSQSYATTMQGLYGYVVSEVVGADKIAKGQASSFADTGGFKKIDDKNFSITFTSPDAAVLWSSIATLQPLPSHILGKVAIKDFQNAAYDKVPTVSSGPFVIKSVVGSDSVTLDANPNYWQGKPHLDHIVFKTVSADVAPGLLANGTVDFQYNGLKPNDVSKLKAIPNVAIQTPPDMGYQYMGFKLYQKEFQDVRVRQAFMYGIDRQSMINGLLKGLGQPLNGPLPSISWAAASTSDGLTNYTYDTAKANELLDAAGWKKGADGFRIDPVTGKTAEIPLDYPLGNTVRMASAVAIQQDMAKVGIKIKLNSPMDFNALSKKVENDDKSVYLWLMGWGLSNDPDPRGMWGAKDAYNYYRWNDAKNEELMKKTYDMSAFDPNTRKQALVQWQVNVNQQLPLIFLYEDDNIYAYAKRFHVPDKDWTVYGPIEPQEWWVK